MANLYSQRTYDAALLLRAASLIAASATESVVLNIGAGLVDADLVLDVTALEVGSNDESYRVQLQGSPDAAFTAGTIACLADICLGAAGSVAKTLSLQGFDDTLGRHLVPFRNEKNGTTYPYVRIRTIVVGTIATGMNFSAFIAKDD
jgi:hypothetical protein